MKTIPPLLFTLALQTAVVSATDQIVTLGDSLSFAYEAEFCFQKNITPIGTVGDGFDKTITRNWIEILGNPAYRGDKFELGVRDDITVSPPFDPPFILYFRQSQNWAIPGLKVDGLRRFLEAQATFLDLIDDDPDFSTLDTIISYSDFNETTDFALTDLENQIQTTAERVTILVGGNDIRSVYNDIYNGASPGTFVADFMADMTVIVNRLQTLNPNVQIVLANVPHVGITPKVRTSAPYDAVKTERVSVVLRDLNSQLAALAAAENIGYADIYTPTIYLIDPARDLCIHGLLFNNVGVSPPGGTGPIWLNGSISKNFHPNTSAQAVIANEIVDAFNRRYHTGIAPLTATEILGSLLGKTTTQIDVAFATWMTRFALTGLPTSDDSDGDGINAGTEFALGLDPTRRDSDKVSSGIVSNELELAYPVRLPTSTKFTLTPKHSTNLATFTAFSPLPTTGTDGLSHARLPLSGPSRFIRLESVVP